VPVLLREQEPVLTSEVEKLKTLSGNLIFRPYTFCQILPFRYVKIGVYPQF
jgi:hypothetical protein